MLSSSLRGNGCNRSFDDLQECLLNTFTGNIARDGGIFGFSSDLIDLIYVDNSALCTAQIKVRCLDQLEQNIFNVLTDITGLCQRRCVCDCERHVQEPCKCLCKKRLAGTGRSKHHDIGFLKLDAKVLWSEQSLIMVVYSDGKDFLGLVLANDIVIEISLDFLRLHQVDTFNRSLILLFILLCDDLRADLYTIFTDIDPCRAVYHSSDLVFCFTAEAAA